MSCEYIAEREARIEILRKKTLDKSNREKQKLADDLLKRSDNARQIMGKSTLRFNIVPYVRVCAIALMLVLIFSFVTGQGRHS